MLFLFATILVCEAVNQIGRYFDEERFEAAVGEMNFCEAGLLLRAPGVDVIDCARGFDAQLRGHGARIAAERA
jgi:hypothetical protein